MEIISVVFFTALFALCLIALNLATDRQDKEETDPCQSCLRWPECNGVDRDTCNLRRLQEE